MKLRQSRRRSTGASNNAVWRRRSSRRRRSSCARRAARRSSCSACGRQGTPTSASSAGRTGSTATSAGSSATTRRRAQFPVHRLPHIAPSHMRPAGVPCQEMNLCKPSLSSSERASQCACGASQETLAPPQNAEPESKAAQHDSQQPRAQQGDYDPQAFEVLYLVFAILVLPNPC